MAWVTLFLAGLLEITWALLLKQSAGFTRPAPTAGFLISAAASMYLLAYSLKTLPVGTAYAVWTGIGYGGQPSSSACCGWGAARHPEADLACHADWGHRRPTPYQRALIAWHRLAGMRRIRRGEMLRLGAPLCTA